MLSKTLIKVVLLMKYCEQYGQKVPKCESQSSYKLCLLKKECILSLIQKCYEQHSQKCNSLCGLSPVVKSSHSNTCSCYSTGIRKTGLLFSSYGQNITITKTDCHGAITSVYISTQLNVFPMQGVCIIQGESMAESPMILENTSQIKS